MKMKKAFTMDQSWFQCIRCEHKADILEERDFRCPECGGLYEAQHDFSHIDVADLKREFDRRAGLFSSDAKDWERSGVWMYRELVMPSMPEKYIVTLGEGKFPIVRVGDHLRRWLGGKIDPWLILEGVHPTDSFKDAGGTVVSSTAKVARVKVGFCSSTGDTSAMASAYLAAAGIPCVVFLPKGKVTPVQLAQPLIYGAKVIVLPGTFDQCMRLMEDLIAKYQAYPLNSINAMRIEGHQATAFQLAHFFNWELPDVIAVVVGNGSNCASVGKGMQLLKRLGFVKKTARILACQSTAASPLGLAWNCVKQLYGKVTPDLLNEYFRPIIVGETSATAARIGNPVSIEKDMREIFASEGDVVVVRERNLNEAVHVVGKDGRFLCPQTGVAMAGVKLAIERGIIHSGERVAIVSTANGLKFTESAVRGITDQIVEAPDTSVETIAQILGL